VLGEPSVKLLMAQGWTPAIDTRRRKLFNSVIATLRDGGRSTVIASAGNPVGFLHLLELYRFERTISDVDTGHMTLTKAARVLDVLRPRVRVRGAARSPDANFPL
jgi:NADPH:quinone reductase-like Zn-dependent oxidoreductase